jgi:hypothetical protein
LPIVKESPKDNRLPDGNIKLYKKKAKLADIEVVILAIMDETLSVGSENHHFSKLQRGCTSDFTYLLNQISIAVNASFNTMW